MATPTTPPPSRHVDVEGQLASTPTPPESVDSPASRTRPMCNAYYYTPKGPQQGGSGTRLTKESPPAQTSDGASLLRLMAEPATMPYSIRICCGNANPTLAHQVAELIGTELLDVQIDEHASGAVNIKLREGVASHDVYIIQSGGQGENGNDLNTSLLEILLLVRRLKLARAGRVTAVIPYFAYSRQDRKTELRSPISASAVAQMLTQMGVDRVVTLDLHSGQVQGAFQSIPLDNLWMYQEFAQWLRERIKFDDPNCKVAVVSPDAGGVVRARKLADLLHVNQVVTILKRRVVAGQIASMQAVGDVEGYHCVIVDDIVDTGGTLAKACEFLKKAGALSVYACCTHGVLSDPACKTLSDCKALKAIIVSDSLSQARNLERCHKLQVLPIAPMLAQVILRHHTEQSVSDLFNQPTPKSFPSPPSGVGFPSQPAAWAPGGVSPTLLLPPPPPPTGSGQLQRADGGAEQNAVAANNTSGEM